MDIASFVIACLSALGTVAAVWYARAQRTIAERATLAAETASEEAKRSADAAAEVAEIERQRWADEVAAAERNRVRFELLSGHGSARFYVAHQGTATAFGVKIDTTKYSGGIREINEIPPGERAEIHLLRAAAKTLDAHVAASWHHNRDLSDSAQKAKLYLN